MGTFAKQYYILPNNPSTKQWPELNKLRENPPPLKLPKKPLPERLQEKPPQPREVSRDHTDSDPVQLPSEKSEDIKRPPTSSLESFLSKDSSEKSLMNSTANSDSNPPRFLLSKKPLKPISLDFSRILTSAQSTPKELLSCPEISNLPEELEVKDSD